MGFFGTFDSDFWIRTNRFVVNVQVSQISTGLAKPLKISNILE